MSEVFGREVKDHAPCLWNTSFTPPRVYAHNCNPSCPNIAYMKEKQALRSRIKQALVRRIIAHTLPRHRGSVGYRGASRGIGPRSASPRTSATMP